MKISQATLFFSRGMRYQKTKAPIIVSKTIKEKMPKPDEGVIYTRQLMQPQGQINKIEISLEEYDLILEEYKP